MINLLPPQEKESILQEEKYKLSLILGILIIAALLCLILILFSIKIYLWGQVESEKIVLSEIQKEFESSEARNFQERIKLTNLTLTKLNSFYQKGFYFTETLEKISKILPPGIYLTNLSLTPLEKEFKAQISLSGYAKTREILFELRQRLETEGNFKELSFPPSNWVKPVDIDFNLTFKLK